MLIAANSLSVTIVPNSYLFLSFTHTIFNPFGVVVLDINFTTAFTDMSSRPFQFFDMKQNILCSIPAGRQAAGRLFHFDVPDGRLYRD
jgi:hypothetical protein